MSNRPKAIVEPPFEEWAGFLEWTLPPEDRRRIEKLLRRFPADDVVEAIRRIERQFGSSFLIAKLLQTKRPLETDVKEALLPLLDWVRQGREIFEALDRYAKGTFEMRLSMGLLGRPGVTRYEKLLGAIERTVYAREGPRPDWDIRVGFPILMGIWKDLTGRQAGTDQTGPFGKFAKAAFAAVDPHRKTPPDIRRNVTRVRITQPDL